VNVKPHHVFAQENGITKKMVKPTAVAPRLPIGKAIIGVMCKMAPNATRPNVQRFLVRHSIIVNVRLRHVLAQGNGRTKKMVSHTMVAPRHPTGWAMAGAMCRMNLNATRPYLPKFPVRRGSIVSAMPLHVLAQVSGPTSLMVKLTVAALTLLTGVAILGVTCKMAKNVIRPCAQKFLVRPGIFVNVRAHHVLARGNGSTKKMAKLTTVAPRLPTGQAIIGVTCKMPSHAIRPSAQKSMVRRGIIVSVKIRPPFHWWIATASTLGMRVRTKSLAQSFSVFARGMDRRH